MTDNSLRDAIEQALFTAIQDQPRGVGGQVVSFYGFEDMPLRLRKTIRDQVDAVLAVFKDPPQWLVDQMTGALSNVLDGQEAMHCTRVWTAWGYGTMTEDDFVCVTEDAEALEEITHAALAALVGGEQS